MFRMCAFNWSVQYYRGARDKSAKINVCRLIQDGAWCLQVRRSVWEIRSVKRKLGSFQNNEFENVTM